MILEAKPPRPKRKYPNTEAAWSSRIGAWCWRARCKRVVDGRITVRVGPLRRTQEQAVKDLGLITGGDARAKRGLVAELGEALDRVLDAARRRGVGHDTVEIGYRGAARAILRYWRPETRLEWLDRDELLWFVREARERGASVATIRGKLLPMLGHCLELAELPNLVPDLVRDLAGTLKAAPPRRQVLTVQEIAQLIDRVRHEVFLDANGHPITIPAREEHADLLALLAATGVRTLELGRVGLADVDLARGEIHVQRAKDPTNPRRLFVGAWLRPVVERIVARAEAESVAGSNPERLLIPNCRTRLGNVVGRWTKRLGEPRLNGRSLRHSFVTGVLQLGGTPYDARVLAGHKSLSTTDRYVGELQSRRPVLDALELALLGSERSSTTPEVVSP